MFVDLLLVGANGQIGCHLYERAKAAGLSVIAYSHEQLDICHEAVLAVKIRQYQPKCIINAAAYTQVDNAEIEQETAYAVNAQGVEYLAKCAAEIGAVLIHISTDYVFDGMKTASYLESDEPRPLSVYGASKLTGELAIAHCCQHHLILRTGWVFGEHGNNFVKTMLEVAAQHNDLTVVADQFGSPTYAGDVAHALLTMMQQALASDFHGWGIYHYSGAPYISWYGFASRIFTQAVEQQLFPQRPHLHPVTSAQYPSVAKRPANSRLDCAKIQSVFNITPSDWQAALSNLLPYMPV
ncbi:dTDP-4-dehydrorhamnose reductase [Shewanella sp. YIC-542]|uniref:dTDP-4-dehydrorhamnose reductase n=1 Tax=Shewanella mytili TaxID=3377111 RepID=UPI00398F3727